ARVQAWLAFRRNLSSYRVLDEPQLRATRRGDTIFIFGSGYSLNAITADEWRMIEAHDTMGFNWFTRQSFVRCDYHLVREILYNNVEDDWRIVAPMYFQLIRDNPCFANTVLLIQSGFVATYGNR